MAGTITSDERNKRTYRQSRQCTSPLPNLALVSYFAKTACPEHSLRDVPLAQNAASFAASQSTTIAMNSDTHVTQSKRTSISSIPRPSSDGSRVIIRSPTELRVTNPLTPVNTGQTPVPQEFSGTLNYHPVHTYRLPRLVLPSPEPLLGRLNPDQNIAKSRQNPKVQDTLVKSSTSASLIPPSKTFLRQPNTLTSHPYLPRFATQTDRIHQRRSDLSKSPQSCKSIDNSGADLHTTASCKLPEYGLRHPGDRKLGFKGEPDPRRVFKAEPVEYWLGRYVACGDRLSNIQHQSELQHSFTDMSKDSADSADTDAALKRKLLAQLITFCQTEEAINGFKQFEYYMYNAPAPTRRINQRKPASTKRDSSYGSSVKQKNVTAPSHAQSETRKMSRSMSSGILQRKVSALAAKSQRDVRTIPRNSRTTSPGVAEDHEHGCSFIPTRKSHQRTISWRSIDYDRRMQHATMQNEILNGGHQGQTTLQEAPFQKYHQQGEEDRAAMQRFDKAQRSLKSSGLVQSGSLPSVISGTSDSSHSSFVTAPSSKHPRSNVVTVIGQHSKDDNNPDITAETSRRFRKSESMKRLVDAGIREIKKIGHRVGHQSGHDSSDE